MMTDPIADMLTRIRNAVQVERAYVEMPTSKMKEGIAAALKREGYIWDHEVVEAQPQNVLRIHLKYGQAGEKVITKLVRESKPGRRVYVGVDSIPRVLGGMGTAVLSTTRGIMSSREAKKDNVGGELLCTIY
ncbi:MAG: 30S ribosomal protein S8 [Planctomycetota bacterium]|nr:30S ribosomal protein S8 [Planctomycetaceae bacterium]MDQ3330072.1 30S ribosomal protein S8 [Planctomycetota bacterium]